MLIIKILWDLRCGGDKMLEITVGELIKRQRKKLNLTQAELAEKINSDSCYISRIETGTRKISIDNLVALANALDTSCDYLLGLGSNVVLHEHVSEMERTLQSLTEDDRELMIKWFYEFASKLKARE
jgi:transcriptional regulator with XRE-family HTH domain